MRKIAHRWVGLDVHAQSIAIAVAEESGEPHYEGKVAGWEGLIVVLRRLGPPSALQICYEAGPTGYWLCRKLREAGYRCVVIAPSLVPKGKGDHIKTDRRDAINLARCFRRGDLRAVWVPDDKTEALRDLSRCRCAARDALHAARQQLSKLLLRHNRKFTGKGKNWGKRHLEWIERQSFEHHAQNLTLQNYLHEVRVQQRRVEELQAALESEVGRWARWPIVNALMALRGVSLLAATVIAVELGDLRRFESARALMKYVGLIPKEGSTGERIRRGPITRAGNRHVRHILVEAAWAYRWVPRVGRDHRLRLEGLGLDAVTQDIAWKAQGRLHRRFTALTIRGKQSVKAATAVARELAGFIWAIGQRAELCMGMLEIPQA